MKILPQRENGPNFAYYNDDVDTVHLPLFGHGPRTPWYARYGISSIAIDYHRRGIEIFSAKNAKQIPGLREVVLIVGRKPQAKCEMTLGGLIEFTEFEKKYGAAIDDFEQWYHQGYVEDLEEGLEKEATRWKKYQNQRMRTGKSRPCDWFVPSVRVAMLEAISETVSPYSYEKNRADLY